MSSRTSINNQMPLNESSQRPSRVSCDSCRAKKIRCTGEHPVCSRCLSTDRECVYSTQMPIGRPKSRRTTLKPNRSRRAEHALSRRSVSPGGRDNWPDNRDHLPTPVSTDQAVDSSPVYAANYQYISPASHPNPQTSFLPTITNQHDPNQCVCLSVLYLLLEQLRMKTSFIAPDDLILLRDTIEKASAVLNCKQCPKSYFSIIQNALILGVVCMCAAECYARILEAIDAEERRASRMGEGKQLNISGGLTGSMFPREQANDNGNTALFPVDVKASEWRGMMRNIVKGELYGIAGRRENCLVSLVERLDERQKGWHQSPPAPDCPPNYRSMCHYPDRIPTCLMLVEDVRNLIGHLGL